MLRKRVASMKYYIAPIAAIQHEWRCQWVRKRVSTPESSSVYVRFLRCLYMNMSAATKIGKVRFSPS